MSTVGSHARFRSNVGPRAGAVAAQGALGPDGVGALEDPVLPRREPGEDLGLHRLRAREAQVGLHAGEGVGREAGALLEGEAHLVVPVDVVGREVTRPAPAASARRAGPCRCAPRARSSVVGVAPEAASPAGTGRSPSGTSRVGVGEAAARPAGRSSSGRCRRACTTGRRRGRARRGCRRSSSRARPASTSLRAERSRRLSVAGPCAGGPRAPASGRRGRAASVLGGQHRRGVAAVRSTHVPTSGSLKRRSSIASSSSRQPPATHDVGTPQLGRRRRGWRAVGPRIVMSAAPQRRGRCDLDVRVAMPSAVIVRRRAGRARCRSPSAGRSDAAGPGQRPASRTASSKRLRGATASTRPHRRPACP